MTDYETAHRIHVRNAEFAKMNGTSRDVLRREIAAYEHPNPGHRPERRPDEYGILMDANKGALGAEADRQNPVVRDLQGRQLDVPGSHLNERNGVGRIMERAKLHSFDTMDPSTLKEIGRQHEMGDYARGNRGEEEAFSETLDDTNPDPVVQSPKAASATDTVTEGEADPYDRTKAYNQDYRLATIPYLGARIQEDAAYTGTDTVSSDEEAPRGPRVRSPTSTAKSEGAMAAGGSNATASDSGAFNARYSSKRFDDFVSTLLGSPRDFSEREHQEAPDHPGAQDVHAD